MGRSSSSATPGQSPRARFALLLGIFFLSGAAGLVYEVTWSRWIALALGASARSLATVLAVFMGGLALGAALGGRLVPRLARPLRWYGVLELGIAAWCLLVPFMVGALDPLFRAAELSGRVPQSALALLQLAACAAVLLPAATAMGATLPLVADAVARWTRGAAWPAGLAYGVNTAGAVAGALAAGFALVPRLGLTSTNLIAVASSAGVGVVALLLGRGNGMTAVTRTPGPDAVAAPAARPERETERLPPGATLPPPTQVLLAGTALAGAAAMACQVAWTRVVVASIGSAVHSFALVVSAFVAGLALGALVLGRLGDRTRSSGVALGLLVLVPLASSLAVVATLPAFGDLPVRAAVVISRHASSFAGLQASQWGVLFAVLLAPTFLFGGLLPLVVRAVVVRAGHRHASPRGSSVGAGVGRAHAFNAVGAVVGSVLGGFVLLPSLGAQGTLEAAAVAFALVGAAFLVTLPARRPAMRFALAAASVATLSSLALAAAPWDARLMTSAPYVDPPALAPSADASVARRLLSLRPEPIFRREDAVASVAVVEARGERRLLVSGKIAGTDAEPAQALIAHVPLLLHERPRKVFLIGLGTGGTLASVLRHDEVERVECVELSPAVAEAARRFFQRERRPLADERVRLVIGDGRRRLRLAGSGHDLVISAPGNPWMAGSSSLYTREAFEEMKRSLAPGGVAAAWLQGWTEPEVVRTLLATACSVFEQCELWSTGSPGHLLLTGHSEPFVAEEAGPASGARGRLLSEDVARRLRSADVAAELARLGVGSRSDLVDLLLLDAAATRRLAAGAPISTDDLDRVGPRSARDLVTNRWPEVVGMLRAASLASASPAPGMAASSSTAPASPAEHGAASAE